MTHDDHYNSRKGCCTSQQTVQWERWKLPSPNNNRHHARCSEKTEPDVARVATQQMPYLTRGDARELWGRLSSLPFLAFQDKQAGKPAPQK